jgi:mRNA-degrading endonuclease toxin of MazEF toxin-antitoxin module
MLILAREEDDYVVAFITSTQEIRSDGDMAIIKDNTNNLAKDWVIRTRKINTVHEDIINKKIGELSSEDQEKIRKLVGDFFSNL